MKKRSVSILLILFFLFFLCSCMHQKSAQRLDVPTKSEHLLERGGEVAQVQTSTINSSKDKGVYETSRKIIRSANITMYVDNFNRGAERLESIAKQYGGQVANKTFQRSGSFVSGTLVLWIPAPRLLKSVEEIDKVGKVSNFSITAQDITDEYYDLDARLRNAKKQEERLIYLLEKKGARLQEILKVEKEMARVRGEVETMEGRQRRMNQQISFSTVTIYLIQDVRAVTEPDDVWKPLRQAIRDAKPTFISSFGGLIEFVAGVLKLFIALLPWAIVIIPVLWILRKNILKKMKKNSVVSLPPPEKTVSPEGDEPSLKNESKKTD